MALWQLGRHRLALGKLPPGGRCAQAAGRANLRRHHRRPALLLRQLPGQRQGGRKQGEQEAIHPHGRRRAADMGVHDPAEGRAESRGRFRLPISGLEDVDGHCGSP